MSDAEKDYRWQSDDGIELEAYKITRGSRWQEKKWPSWLRMQATAKDDNCVYTDASAPNALFIQIDGAQYQIADGAYITYDGGRLRVQDGENFEATFTKVVPIPPRNLDPASLPDFEDMHRVEDGKLVKLTPEEIAEKAAAKVTVKALSATASVTKLQPNAMTESDSRIAENAKKAFELLCEGLFSEAETVLRDGLSAEVKWCNCAPHLCDGGPRWSCRRNSPLAK